MIQDFIILHHSYIYVLSFGNLIFITLALIYSFNITIHVILLYHVSNSILRYCLTTHDIVGSEFLSTYIRVYFVSRAFCETIRMTFGVCVCVCMYVCVCVCVQGISPSITGRILMKLRMDIPVHHAQCV